MACFLEIFFCASLGACAHFQHQMLIYLRTSGRAGRCICLACLDFSEFHQAAAAAIVGFKQHRDTGTAASLQAESDTLPCFNCHVWCSFSFTDFLIICCLQVHLASSGRWCGLVGSLLALVGEHLGDQLVHRYSVASGPSQMMEKSN